MKALTEFLEANQIVLDAEAETGWYFYRKNSGESDDLIYLSQDAAVEGALRFLGIENLVLSGDPNTTKNPCVVFAGTYAECLNYMRKSKKTELIYPSGRMASYVL